MTGTHQGAAGLKAKRILWVDDEPDCAFFHRKYLEHVSKGGFEVTSAVDAAEAVELLLKEYWDLVILDVVLPVKDTAPARPGTGLQLLRWIRTEYSRPELPVVAVTGYRKGTVQEEFQALGATLIYKPADPDKIANELNRVLAAAPVS
ncbi:MAG: response regulator [Armatimonadetes bacterium]|nr:response regulator [Armatimonadota bacterium]